MDIYVYMYITHNTNIYNLLIFIYNFTINLASKLLKEKRANFNFENQTSV